MVSTTESSGKAIAQHRLLVPRLSLMMFLQFFIWGSWSVTLGLVMTQHNMSLLIGDAFSAGPIASILSPFVLGMLVDRFFASQKVMAVMHLAGAVILWFVPGALIAQNGALLIGLLFGYTLCYMPTLALTNNIAFHSLANVDKTFPVVRVFGTIGWIVAGIFIGVTGVASSVTIFRSGSKLCAAGALQPDAAPYPGTGKRAAGSGTRSVLRRRVRAAQNAPLFCLLRLRNADLRPTWHLLRLYRLLSGGRGYCGRQHRDVVRADVRNILHAGDPAAFPPSGRESYAADRHAGVVCALRHVCAGRQRRRARPAVPRHFAARCVL